MTTNSTILVLVVVAAPGFDFTNEVEVHKIAQDLADQSERTADPIVVADIEAMVNNAVLQEASPEDVARVSARLAAGGWPLADPPRED